MIFNPHTYDPSAYDPETQRQLKALIQFFEDKGLAEMKDDFHQRAWYQDFLDFNAKEGILAAFGTPAAVGGEGARWDTARINDLNEILGFYSLSYWYAWQVTVLGLGPVWMSENEEAKQLVGKLLESGAIFGFGLSEQSHGADIYSTDMILTPTDGGWVANGPKYYIGNGNVAGRLSVFGKFADTGEYVFFLVDTQAPEYELQKNVVADQMYVSAFALHDYPVTQADILHTGKAAWDAALATVNVGKVNLGWASIGICEHAFYEAVTHADHRVLYGTKVTTFPHVRRMFADAYARLLAMKLYSARSADYFRSASEDDRRFLLFNPITKMKVTSEGERVIDLSVGDHRGPWIREGHVLRAGGRAHPGAAEAGGHRPREPRAGAEVPAAVPHGDRRVPGGSGAPGGGRRRLPVPAGTGIRAWAGSRSRRGDPRSSATSTCPTSHCSWSRSTRSLPWSCRLRPARRSRRIWTSCSPSGSCSPRSSTHNWSVSPPVCRAQGPSAT